MHSKLPVTPDSPGRKGTLLFKALLSDIDSNTLSVQRGPLPGYESFYPFFLTLRMILLLEIFKFIFLMKMYQSFKCMQVALVVMNLPANAGDRRDVGSIRGWRRSTGGGHSNLL